MAVVSNIGLLILKMESWSANTKLISQEEFNLILDEIRTIASMTFKIGTGWHPTVYELNRTLREHAIPHYIDYDIDKSEIHLRHENVLSGFRIRRSNFNSDDTTMQMVGQNNLNIMLSDWAKVPIDEESLEKFCGQFSLLYDIAYDQFIDGKPIASRFYDVEDINLLMYHRRIGYRIRKTDTYSDGETSASRHIMRQLERIKW